MEDRLFENIEEYLAKPQNDEDKGVFENDEDISTLILSFAYARGEKGITEEETVNLIRWAEQQIIGYNLLQLVLKGLALIDDPEGKFEDPLFSLTDLGKELGAELT